jgi:hypothetical protein
LRVLEDVFVVIIIDEREVKRLAEDEPRDRTEEKANAENHPAIVQANRTIFRP